MSRGTAKIGALVAVVATLALGVSLADATLVARGGLFVSFNGGISPNALPRTELAPISVTIAGKVRTLSGERPPALRQIAVAINSGGRLNTSGLPVCHRRQIEASSSNAALAACGPALVGHGKFTANVALPEQSSFPSRGRILAFNAVVNGRRAILAHVYGVSPAPSTRIVVFYVSRAASGTFGTVLTAYLPADLNRNGYLTSIELSLHRTFTYRGRQRSYLSAACSAPAGFPGAVFTFAHASMTFADGRTLAATLTRSCRVRE